MHREGQPRGIQRIFTKFKRAEMQRRAEPHNTQTPERAQQPRPAQKAQVSWEHDPRLDQTAKERIRAELRVWSERANQAWNEYHNSLPKPTVPNLIELNGNMLTPLEYWIAYSQQMRHQESIHFAPLVAEQTLKSVKKDQRKTTATLMYKKLVKEVADSHLVDAASILQKEVWNDDPNNPKATVNRYGDMHIILDHKNGLVKDRSYVGFSLANPTEGNEIFYGIGYFGNEQNFIPSARGIIHPEDLKKGAKAYFIERTYRRGIEEVTELDVIPCASEDSLTEFFDRLYNNAVKLSPTPQQLAA